MPLTILIGALLAGCSGGSATLAPAPLPTATPTTKPTASPTATPSATPNPVYISSTGTFNAASQTLTLVADGPTAAVTLHGPDVYATDGAYTIHDTNVGTASCPTGAVAISNLTPELPEQMPIVVAGYAAATCTYSLTQPSGAPPLATFSIVVTPATTMPSSAGTIVMETGQIETFDPNNPTVMTTLSPPNAGAFVRDQTGATFVAENSIVAKYAPNATGSAAPIASVNLGTGTSISSLAVDPTGHLYALAATANAAQVLEYSSDLSTQIAVLSGSATQLFPGLAYPNSLAVDERNDVFVLSFPDQNAAIQEFAPLTPGSNGAAPIFSIPGYAGANTAAPGIALDAAGNIWFNQAVFGQVFEYAPGSTTQIGGVSALGNISPFTVSGNRVYAIQSGDSYEQSNSLVYYTVGSSAPAVPVLTHANGIALQVIPPASASPATRLRSAAAAPR